MFGFLNRGRNPADQDQEEQLIGDSVSSPLEAHWSGPKIDFRPHVTLVQILLTTLQLVVLARMVSVVGQSCTSWGPESSTHPHEFSNNPRFQDTGHQFDQVWEGLVPASQGITTDKHNQTAGISMFHQLHCLASFRAAIQQLQDGLPIGHSAESDTAADQGHWPHCFDYLRQVLLCHADDTREPLILDHGGISGFGVQRTCRDSERLYRLARQQEDRRSDE